MGGKTLKLQFQIILKISPSEIFYFSTFLFCYSRYSIQAEVEDFNRYHCAMDASIFLNKLANVLVLSYQYFRIFTVCCLLEIPFCNKEIYIFRLYSGYWKKNCVLQCAVFDKTLAELKTQWKRLSVTRGIKQFLLNYRFVQ